MNGLRALKYWVVVATVTAAAVAGALWAVSQRFGWLDLWGSPTAAVAPVDEPVAGTPERELELGPSPAEVTLSETLTAAVTASSSEVTAPTVTSGALLGATGPEVCTPSFTGAVHSAAAKVSASGVDTVAVAVAAFGPALGSPAFEVMRSEYDNCEQPVAQTSATRSGTNSTSARSRTSESTSGRPATKQAPLVRPAPDGPGTEAFTVTASGVRATLLRRGDVVVEVLSVGAANPFAVYGNDPSLDRHNRIVAAADAALAAALEGRCVDQVGNADDPGRNPFSGVEFTGLLEVRSVGLADIPSDASTTTAPPSATPSTAHSVPPEALALQDWVNVTRQGSAFAELTQPPTPRPRWRAAPVEPAAAPTQQTFQVRVPDPEGPGCGWAFTGAAVPAVDAPTLSAAADSAHDQAVGELVAARSAATAAAEKFAAAELSYELYDTQREAWALYDSELRRRTPAPVTTTTTTTTTVPPSTTTTSPPSTTTSTLPPSTTTSTTTSTLLTPDG